MAQLSTPRALAALLVLLCSCGGTPPQPEAPDAPSIQGVERYFPLGDGYVYTYETVNEDGSQDMLLLKARRIGPHRAQLHTGSGVRDLTVTAEAIQRVGSGFVLRAPIREGATWDGDNGGATRVESVDITVTVPAGKLENCIRTVEEIASPKRGRITTVYCESVGIAEMHVEQWEGTDHASKRFQLRSYGPPVDLDAAR